MVCDPLFHKSIVAYRFSLPVFLAILVVLILSTFSLGMSNNITPFTHGLFDPTGSLYLQLSPNKLSASMVGHFL